MNDATPRSGTGLVLPGGGARAAYQVGVLKALVEILPDAADNPFPVIVGTSAGSINAAVLAAHARHFSTGVSDLVGLWENIQVNKVFRTDTWELLSNSLRWLWAIIRGDLGAGGVHSLLDNTPLRGLLERHIRLARVQQAIDAGELAALAITASSYGQGRSVTFFQARQELPAWSRTRRGGRPAEINLDHLMASTAIPLIFPAVRIGREYFGDGAMRQAAPLSPAIHLGAQRILVIGVRNEAPDELPERPRYPSFGQIMGYLLDTLFMDSLHTDLERLKRVNGLLESLGRQGANNLERLRPIDVTVIVPSQDIRPIAQRYARRLPRSVKLLLRSMGGLRASGRQLVSYLLFDGGFCRELIEMGYQDGLAQREELRRFAAPTAERKAPKRMDVV